MLIKVEKRNGEVDCITICPEDNVEKSLLNGIIEDQVNLKTGMFLLYKEDQLKGKKIREGLDIENNDTHYQEFHHG